MEFVPDFVTSVTRASLSDQTRLHMRLSEFGTPGFLPRSVLR